MIEPPPDTAAMVALLREELREAREDNARLRAELDRARSKRRAAVRRHVVKHDLESEVVRSGTSYRSANGRIIFSCPFCGGKDTANGDPAGHGFFCHHSDCKVWRSSIELRDDGAPKPAKPPQQPSKLGWRWESNVKAMARSFVSTEGVEVVVLHSPSDDVEAAAVVRALQVANVNVWWLAQMVGGAGEETVVRRITDKAKVVVCVSAVMTLHSELVRNLVPGMPRVLCADFNGSGAGNRAQGLQKSDGVSVQVGELEPLVTAIKARL